MTTGYYVELGELIREFDLEVIHAPQGYESIRITKTGINRPGLQLVGFYDYFDTDRIQLLGKVEWTYLRQISHEDRELRINELLQRPIPAIIVARGLDIDQEAVEAARKHDRTLLRSQRNTASLQAHMINYLTRQLSQRITRHGVLMEIYGEGVFLTGESGVGKSETAIELIKRGHRLIADDAVDIRRVGIKTLEGSAPELIRYYVELRGIGIIDVRRLFGMAAVKDRQQIDMVVNMEQWRDGMLYDRLGLENRYMTILDVDLPLATIPVKPGRNLAVIIEVAAMNNRTRKMGYNAAQEFSDQINAHFERQIAQQNQQQARDGAL